LALMPPIPAVLPLIPPLISTRPMWEFSALDVR